ncbi:hypothetical protein A8C32_01030 [Flavivirga aquatica]|uniref:Spondin domain-containing protein n=1 Tax=Flavivirga aquatica TaxID=1849968 RepID=A0A1E5TC23_9FLAO|nr:spondin domain-containing protein [Flavivirga aquatica]OEK08887.1 hypothetical protein A8C32_01030 [Flavivirga aquatica]
MKKITFLLIFILTSSLYTFSQSTANYTITFDSFWESEAANPTNGISTIDLPGNAHWSPLVGATHKTANTFLMMGMAASPGIESIAETGATSTFQTEVTTNTDADKYIPGGGLATGKGTITLNNIEVSEGYPFITLASMIAPSPDWFVAVNSINLRSGNNSVENGWKETFSVDLFPYDAGTEAGSGYSGNNASTVGVITSRSNTTPFNNKRIGTMTFTLNSTLSTDTIDNLLDNIKVYPSPAKDNITISNIKNIKLNTIEIYNVLGRLVKKVTVTVRTNKININLTNLNKGVYLLNLKAVNGSKTQKFVLN